MAKKSFFKQKWKAFKQFYNASEENRIGIYNMLAFIIVPAIGMTILFIIVRIFLWR